MLLLPANSWTVKAFIFINSRNMAPWLELKHVSRVSKLYQTIMLEETLKVSEACRFKPDF